MSERTEETSLLPEDEVRRLPLDDIIIVVDAQMPIRAKRIQYFDDPYFKGIHAAQKGRLPFPPAVFEKAQPLPPPAILKPETSSVAVNPESTDVLKSDVPELEALGSVEVVSTQPHRAKLRTSKRKQKAKAVDQATRDLESIQGELNEGVQQRLNVPDQESVSDADRKTLAAADEKLAALEAEFVNEGQGGVSTTAA